MEEQHPHQEEPATIYGPDGKELPHEEPEEDWADIGQRIERLLRRDVARLVRAEHHADWSEIADAATSRAKEQADRTEVGRRAEEIGREVEEQLRRGVAQAAGADREADWGAIARTLRERVERLLDPGRSARRGESAAEAVQPTPPEATKEEPSTGGPPPTQQPM